MDAEKGMKKNDWILLIIVLCVASAIVGIKFLVGDQNSGYVTIRVGGEIKGTYKLSEDKRIELNSGMNTIEIEGGEVKMVSADCPDQLCVHQKRISKNNESIICLPNRVVVQVVSQDESELDAVTN